MHLWDDEGWERLSERHLQLVRETGALGDLPTALSHRGQMHVFAGELATAASLHDAIQDATELTGTHFGPYHGVGMVAMRGREAEAKQFIEKARAEVIERGEGAGLSFIDWAEAVLYNGLGRYAEALTASRRVLELAELVPVSWAMPELIEAAVRTGARELAAETDRHLTDRSRASGTDWAVGIAARSHALVVEDERADDVLHRGDRATDTHASRRRPGSGAPALRRVASPPASSGGRSQRASNRLRDVHRLRNGGVRRAGAVSSCGRPASMLADVRSTRCGN